MERDWRAFFNRRIGGRIRDRRLALGLTQAEVAAAIGIGPELYAGCEDGSARAGADVLLRLSSLLGLRLDELYQGIASAIHAAGFTDTEQARYALKPLASQSKELDTSFRRIKDATTREMAIRVVEWLADHEEAGGKPG